VGGQTYTLDSLGNALAFDFDGGPDNMLGGAGIFGIAPQNEVSICYGDSGGPSFAGNVLAGAIPTVMGVHSFANDFRTTATPVCGFGEVGGDTRVSAHLGWIESTQAAALVPEPATWCVVGIGLGLLAMKRYSK
jgi:Trypsin